MGTAIISPSKKNGSSLKIVEKFKSFKKKTAKLSEIPSVKKQSEDSQIRDYREENFKNYFSLNFNNSKLNV
jgi:hypothetical protein